MSSNLDDSSNLRSRVPDSVDRSRAHEQAAGSPRLWLASAHVDRFPSVGTRRRSPESPASFSSPDRQDHCSGSQ